MNFSYRLKLMVVFWLMVILGVNGALFAGSIPRSAGAFLRLGLGADRVAMGDCGTALVGSGMSWYYNPASIPFQQAPQASLGYRKMALDRFLMYAEYSMPIEPNAGIAGGILRAGTSDVDYRDSNGNIYDTQTISENMIHGTFALMPHERVTLGISIKWIINITPNVIGDDEALYTYAMGVDLGTRIIATNKLRFGLQLRDLGSRYSWETSDVWGDQSSVKDDSFPTIFRVGAAYDPTPAATVTSDVLIHSAQLGDDSEALELHLGGEYRYALTGDKLFAMRAGWNGDVPTFGFGIIMEVWRMNARMDYAYLIEEVAPSGSHLIGWVFEF